MYSFAPRVFYGIIDIQASTVAVARPEHEKVLCWQPPCWLKWLHRSSYRNKLRVRSILEKIKTWNSRQKERYGFVPRPEALQEV